jgi:glyoxylase-like metal-dependent hydrolase (beta-lactamase superfamily II)
VKFHEFREISNADIFLCTTGTTWVIFMPMEIQTIVVGPFEVNCYIITSNKRDAIVIDPGDDPDLIKASLQKRKLTPVVYLLTHGHIDHVSAVPALYDAFPAAIAIHKADAGWAFSDDNNMPPFYPSPARPPEIARLLDNNQEWTDSGLAYSALSTPGHTPGSVCFYFQEESTLFTGDTLFAGSVGRTDLPGGNSRSLAKSLSLLSGLPLNTVVYPGHGPSTDIGKEKSTNYFMQKTGLSGLNL